jgi:hypothetical protein
MKDKEIKVSVEQFKKNGIMDYKFINYLTKGKLSKLKIKEAMAPVIIEHKYDRKEKRFVSQPQECLTRKLNGFPIEYSKEDFIEILCENPKDFEKYTNDIVDELYSIGTTHLMSVTFSGIDESSGYNFSHIQTRGRWSDKESRLRLLDEVTEVKQPKSVFDPFQRFKNDGSWESHIDDALPDIKFG